MEATLALRQPSLPTVLFPHIYLGVILFASLDVILTRFVLRSGGFEANPIAGAVIDAGGVWGMVLLKFTAVALVLTVCEFIGRDRQRLRLAHALGLVALVLNALPVMVGLSLLYRTA